MEQVPPDGKNVSSISSEELDSNEGTPRCHHSDSISQAEEESEDREELTGDPAKELAVESAEELAVEPTEELTKEPAVECPASG